MSRNRFNLNKYLFSGLLLGIVALMLSRTEGANALASIQQCGQWNIVASPSKDTMDILYSIAAISPQDVWTVGRYVDKQNEALIEHWNGSQWSIVQGAGLGPDGSYLHGIAAVSATDVWAVGARLNGNSSSTLIEHWDGAQWSVVSSPSTGGLSAVSVISAVDIWAVGANAGQTLTEHWNGARWSIVPSPNPGKFGNGLDAVTTISPTDVWAVGVADTTKFGFQSLALNWNGAQWSVVKTPVVSQYPYELRAVSAANANDVWATGDYTIAPGNIMLTLTEHWNGMQWSVVSSPSPTGDDALLGVDALSASNAWAVGDASSKDQNLALNWNGTNWNIVPTPFRSGAISSFYAVSADSASDVWAAGYDINTQNFTYRTLIEHYFTCG